MSWPLLVLGLSLAASAAEAQTVGEPVGELYLSGSPDGYVSEISVASLETFYVYVLADVDYGEIGHPEWNSMNGIRAWEAGLDHPSDVVIYSNWPYCQTGAICVRWRILESPMVLAQDTPHVVARMGVIVTGDPVPQNLHLRLTEYWSPELPGAGPVFRDGAAVGECSLPDGTPTTCLRPFARTGDLWINRTVPVDTESWSALKARFEP